MGFVTHVLTGGASSRVYGAERDPQYGVTTYRTRDDATVPARLRPYLPGPHTWERHVQRLINGTSYTGAPARATIEYRGDYQQNAVTEIVSAAGGYTLALPTGAGKTIAAIAAMNQMRPANVLVISLLTHLETWREEISTYSDPSIEWVVINPDQLGALLYDPDRSLHTLDVETRDRLASTTGVPITSWDVVICDEAHILANPYSLRSRLWRRHVRWGEHGPESFTLNLSATPWTRPEETSSAAHILARALDVPVPDAFTVDHDYFGWLKRCGFELARDARGRWRWEENPADTSRIAHLLFSGGRGMSATADDLGIDPQPRSLHPITFTPAEHERYEQPWTTFWAHQPANRKASALIDPPKGLTAQLRRVQKASLIKAPHVADLVAQKVREGNQVIVPAWYSETAHHLGQHIAHALTGVTDADGNPARVYVMTGDDPEATRVQKRRRFQSGLAKVIVTSIVESINLHAGQRAGGVDGEDATDAPRVTIYGDVLTGGKRAFQAEGRGSRDGQIAEAIYPYAADTSEQAWMASMFYGLANTKALSFDGARPTQHDIASFMRMAQALDPDEGNRP